MVGGEALSGIVLSEAFAMGDVLEGDFNDDVVVDAADYTVWCDNIGATDEGTLNGNGSNSGGVDAADYELWRNNFGASGLGSGASVPEPAAGLLLGVAACFAMHTVGRSKRPMSWSS